MSAEATKVYTDGSCSPNPGRGGWAWWVSDTWYASGAEVESTNQRMELQAIWEAMKDVPGDLVIVTDSQYAMNCLTEWWKGWERNGWKRRRDAAVKNSDILKPLVAQIKANRDRVRFEWVKGHSGTYGNDRADWLATRAGRTQCAVAEGA